MTQKHHKTLKNYSLYVALLYFVLIYPCYFGFCEVEEGYYYFLSVLAIYYEAGLGADGTPLLGKELGFLSLL